jgi:putative acetyltransferase
MTPQIHGNMFWLSPHQYNLRNGVQVSFRLEEKTDLEPVWRMFSSLSRNSLEFLPIPITRERVEGWFDNIDYEKALVILGCVEEDGETRVVAVSSLSFNESQYNKHKANFGITVHDDYQGIGLGSYLTGYMIEIAKAKGITRIELEVVAHNLRAIRVYEKNGFIKEGLLRKNHWNHILDDYCDDIIMGYVVQ